MKSKTAIAVLVLLILLVPFVMYRVTTRGAKVAADTALSSAKEGKHSAVGPAVSSRRKQPGPSAGSVHRSQEAAGRPDRPGRKSRLQTVVTASADNSEPKAHVVETGPVAEDSAVERTVSAPASVAKNTAPDHQAPAALQDGVKSASESPGPARAAAENSRAERRVSAAKSSASEISVAAAAPVEGGVAESSIPGKHVPVPAVAAENSAPPQSVSSASKSSTLEQQIPPAAVPEGEIDCLQCHATLKGGKVEHPALEMGCAACHTDVDARTVPHKITNKTAAGLSSEPPELCYGCHDKEIFTKKDIHPAIGMAGCTGCHDPHSSENEKLLKAASPDLCYGCHDKQQFTDKEIHPAIEMAGCSGCHNPHSSENEKLLQAPTPDLCYGCHDKGTFTKKEINPAIEMAGCTGCHSPHSTKNKNLLKTSPPDLCFTCHDRGIFTRQTVHPPVAAGLCVGCHSPHSSDQMALLLSAPVELCLGCHPEIPEGPHGAVVFTATSHPLGLSNIEKKGVAKAIAAKTEPVLMNPSQPDKIFYCGSCHNPHSARSPFLFRFDETSTMGLCSHCHKR